MSKPWSRFSIARRFNSNSKRDELQAIHFGRGTNSHGDGPAEDFTLSRGLMSESDFAEIAAMIECGRIPQGRFLNMIRSLYYIEADELPELSETRARVFLGNPVAFLVKASESEAAAIFREVLKRQQ